MVRDDLAHHRPSAAADAAQLLAEHGEQACVLGGGTVLVPQLTRAERRVRHVVDLRGLGLDGVQRVGDEVEVGSMVTYGTVLCADPTGDRTDLLRDVADAVTGGCQLRNLGTLGGSACYGRPSLGRARGTGRARSDDGGHRARRIAHAPGRGVLPRRPHDGAASGGVPRRHARSVTETVETTPSTAPAVAPTSEGHLRVNGEDRTIVCEDRTLLVSAIRDDLGLKGTRVGCLNGDCGMCSIRLDGVAVKSCLMLAASADGSEITTVEGLADGDELSPQAMIGNLCRCTGYAHMVNAVERVAAERRS